jgi:mannose-1-phosphate guanylyltransferase
MKAILLAAGLGTRLRPITNTVPKCLVPVFGRPLLEIWLERLSAAGVGPFLVNTHYLADQVEAYVSRSIYRSDITLVNESRLLGTAGTLRRNLDFFGGQDGMLVHADNYCLADFARFQDAHRSRPPECVMTMMTFRASNPTSCGIVELDSRGVVCGFHEKVSHPPGDIANGAIYILDSRLQDQIRDATSDDFSTQVIPGLLGRIYTYQCTGILEDIGTLEAYEKYRIKT